MKRGAEKQLTKDDDASDEETDEVSTTFKKADDNSLATRRIRGLPKRGSAATTNGNSAPELPASAPKFSGFAGFGAPSANSAFTFATVAKPPSATTQTPSEAQSQPVGTLGTPPHLPTVSSTASSTAKTLASFLGAPPDSSASQKLTSTGPATSLAFPLAKPSNATPTTSAPTTPTPSSTAAEPTTATDSAIKYYTELRGLNASLLASITKAIQDDAFVDISQVMEQYRTHRTRIQDDYDKLKKAEINKPDPGQPKRPPAMPAPPSSLSFGNKTFGSSTFKLGETSNGGGFAPSIPAAGNATPSPFKFPSTTLASPSEPETTKTTATTTTATTATPFAFGTSSDGSASSAFGNLAKKDSSSGFKFTSSLTSAAPVSSPFGGSNLFTAPPSSSPFAQPSSAVSSFGGFGKPSGSGSIGNPVGFGFGAGGSKGSDADSAAKTTPPTGFTFGQPSTTFGTFGPAKSVKTEEGEGEGEEGSCGGDDASAATTEGDDASKFGLSGPAPHDVEGEGEEDEETTYFARIKAYRMKKEDERGGKGWVELGVGNLRLKKHKETDARRMLLRNSSTGKININFKLYSGLKVIQTKKSLTFVGHDNGVSQTYNVRVPEEEQARQLKEAIERELDLLQPQEG